MEDEYSVCFSLWIDFLFAHLKMGIYERDKPIFHKPCRFENCDGLRLPMNVDCVSELSLPQHTV